MALESLTDATPDTSSDEIKAYAESVVQEIAQERKGEPERKSDAQIVSELGGTSQTATKTNETPAEKNSGSDTATNDGEETGNVERPEWMTDDVTAEAAAYGIDESELADFTSREELDRALRLFDKTALEAGRKALAEGEKAPVRDDKGKFVKKEEPKTEPPKAETPKDGRFEISQEFREAYDEGLVSEVERMNAYYEARFAAFESHFEAERVTAQERHFDSLVDSLGHTDLFGKTDKETVQEKQRREDLFVEAETYLKGREALGRPTELNEAIIKRIARSLFAEEIGKKELKQRTKSISKQSDRRQGGSPTKPLPPSDNPRDQFDRLYKELASS